MQAPFWIERWEQGLIGWHQSQVHRALPACWAALGIASTSRVFVPLCGKSLDMVWLRERGHGVVGVDLSPLAVRDFFHERALVPSVDRHGDLQLWAAGGYELWVGDLFALTTADLGRVDAIYDRASLIALPPEMRPRYAAQIAALTRPGCRGLLITMEYDQSLVSGPPFSVPGPEVAAALAPSISTREIERVAIPADNPRFRDAGIATLTEVSYCLERR